MMKGLQAITVKAGDQVLFDIDKTVSDTHILELLFFIREREYSTLGFVCWKVWMYGFWGPILKVMDRWSRPHAQSLIYRWYEQYDEEKLVLWSQRLFRERLLGKCYPAVRDWLYQLKDQGAAITFVTTNIEPVAQAYAEHFGGRFEAVSLGKLRGISSANRIEYLRERKQKAVACFSGPIALGVGDSRYDESLLETAEVGVVISSREKPWMAPYGVYDRTGAMKVERAVKKHRHGNSTD